ncbi:tetrapyrrole biosynthesis uroporphyrinogen III synthase [Auriscalpium vulgare]|uniref:Tetrapyrrole biosynthesis uroporphyrinogen III synthase n=1 Tax=Auriscalpium vulgare TaxID=40419 RepID=A0ACB8S8M9_9AGAM|nr:tetrapyrrole biosynthesis uroporphyrinogen III synthase [Auriscalpium vulgare]
MTASQPVLLLRAPSDPSDPYATTLRAAQFEPVSIPVLETVLVSGDTLARRIAEGPKGMRAVIITSARAAEAWGEAVGRLCEGDVQSADWTKIPFYTVGPATATVLSELSSSHSPSLLHLFPIDIRGAQTGNASALAKFIVQEQGDPSNDPHTHVFYLIGDKNRDTLPRILHDGGLRVDELQVYATRGARSFPDDLEKALQKHAEVTPERRAPWWIVFFAPSAAAYVLPYLQAHFCLRPPQLIDAQGETRRNARVAAIGPTTADFIRSEMSINVDVVAETPNAEGLVRALAGYTLPVV